MHQKSEVFRTLRLQSTKYQLHLDFEEKQDIQMITKFGVQLQSFSLIGNSMKMY